MYLKILETLQLKIKLKLKFKRDKKTKENNRNLLIYKDFTLDLWMKD